MLNYSKHITKKYGKPSTKWERQIMSTRIISADEVINAIAEVLREADGTFIEEIANKILTDKVAYSEDSLFVQTIEEEKLQDDNDISNADEFECNKCHKHFDIDDSIRLGGRHGNLVCPECSKGICPSCKRQGIIGDACPLCTGFTCVDPKGT
jgi:hypothetical protein